MNLSKNQELLELAIICFILMTLMFDSGVKLLGETRCVVMTPIKGLIEDMSVIENFIRTTI